MPKPRPHAGFNDWTRLSGIAGPPEFTSRTSNEHTWDGRKGQFNPMWGKSPQTKREQDRPLPVPEEWDEHVCAKRISPSE